MIAEYEDKEDDVEKPEAIPTVPKEEITVVEETTDAPKGLMSRMSKLEGDV
jgi:hypothetical protein